MAQPVSDLQCTITDISSQYVYSRPHHRILLGSTMGNCSSCDFVALSAKMEGFKGNWPEMPAVVGCIVGTSHEILRPMVENQAEFYSGHSTIASIPRYYTSILHN